MIKFMILFGLQFRLVQSEPAKCWHRLMYANCSLEEAHRNLWRGKSWLALLKLSANLIDLIRQGGVSGLNFDFYT